MEAEKRTPVTARPAPHQQYFPVERPQEAAKESRKDWGLYEGEPETCRRRLVPFLRSMIQLGLLVALFKTYQIEGRAFDLLTTLACVALPVHYLLPFRWKKPFYVATSIFALFCVMGSSVAWIVLGTSAVLIGVCRLPIAWTTRVGILAVLGGLLAVARSESLIPEIHTTAIPIVATLFMFRILIYMYELKHAKSRESLIDAATYFFMLPNLSFTHFPVVDYRTFLRGYFADDVHAIQQRGLQMMFRGTLHLLCYRLIYHELLLTPAEVTGPLTLAAYVVCNYLLYLRVSGQFHMACGMLHLFGFQLPDTHHHYLLASGFTDYWRRVNIYWKDFMIRLFFNPVVFKLKRWPQPAALAIATLVVFFATWVLHAYQSYWLRGSWGFSVPDALFWGILGALVVVNVQLDARKSRNRAGSRLKAKQAEAATGLARFQPLALRCVKTAATFTTIALLWSLWSSPTLTEWLGMLRRGILGV